MEVIKICFRAQPSSLSHTSLDDSLDQALADFTVRDQGGNTLRFMSHINGLLHIFLLPFFFFF